MFLLGGVIGLVALLDCPAVWSQAAPPDEKPSPVRRALLIGINNYQNLPHLQGSINDIETMRHILVTRWGFKDQHITMLKEEAATRAGILAALNQLVSETAPEDIVYFHYSGHGSQVKDLNGDEKDDGLDETIVPQNGRTEGVPDITDDELDEIVARLRARSALIVLDSCHSGTATRSAKVLTRSVPQDTRLDLYRKVASGTRGLVPVLTSRYILMTGAAAHQEALDGPVDGRYHGFFTYALSKSLSSASPSASPRDVFTGVERELKRVQTQFGRSSMPEPQLEAPTELLDRPLLSPPQAPAQEPSSSEGPRLSWVEVQPSTGGQVLLMKGLLLSAVPGSVWAIYPPGETSFPLGQALAVATVTQLQGNDAVATTQPVTASVSAGARAVALLPPPAPARVPVRLLEMPPDQRTRIEESLRKQLSDVDMVGPDQFARFLVDLQGSTVQVYAADGLQSVGSFALSAPHGDIGLARLTSVSANAADLLALDHPSSQLRLQARVVSPAPMVASRGVGVVAADTSASRFRIRRSGEPRTLDNSLQLEVRANVECYLTVVDVDSRGGVNLLFPNEYQHTDFYPAGKIPGGKMVIVPDSVQPGNRAGFYWDYVPPGGTDTIRVFASTDRETANMIRQGVNTLRTMPGASTRGGATTRAAVTESMEHLRRDLAGMAMRGIVTARDEPPPLTGAQAPEAQTTMDRPSISSGQVPSPPGSPHPDWTAASLTVLVSD